QASPIPLPLMSLWVGLATCGQLSQASPMPSPSESVWSRLATNGQLSLKSGMPSPSESSVKASVLPSSVLATHTEHPQPHRPPPPTSLGLPQLVPRHSGLSCAMAGVAHTALSPSAANETIFESLVITHSFGTERPQSNYESNHVNKRNCGGFIDLRLRKRLSVGRNCGVAPKACGFYPSPVSSRE